MWRRYWFLLALAAVIPLGLKWPHGGDRLREAGWVLPLLVGVTLFISGFTLDTARLAKGAIRVSAVLVGVATTFVVAPVFAYGLARLWRPDVPGPDSPGFYFLQAIMLAAAQAGTLASAIALTTVARGDQALAFVLTLATNVLTVVFTPLILELSIGALVSFPAGDMMARMALVIVLPVFLGQAARRLFPRTARPVLRIVGFVPQGVILVFVYTGFGAAAEHLVRDAGLVIDFLGVCVLLHVLLVAWTWSVSALLRLPGRSRTAVVFCGSQKTLPNAIYLWERFFPANPYGAVGIVLYHLFQLVADTLLVPWLEPRRRAGR